MTVRRLRVDYCYAWTTAAVVAAAAAALFVSTHNLYFCIMPVV